MKNIVLSICNSLMAVSITRILNQSGDFQVYSVKAGCQEILRRCTACSADILLMEVAYDTGATLGECLAEVKKLRSFRPACRIVLLCDENSVPEVARGVARAKKDGLIDDFVYSSVSESYITAMLYAI